MKPYKPNQFKAYQLLVSFIGTIFLVIKGGLVEEVLLADSLGVHTNAVNADSLYTDIFT